MAKVKTLGRAIVIKSRLKLEDIKRAMQMLPETLVVKDEKGNESFKVEYSEDKTYQGMNKRGAVFCDADEDGFAYVTITSLDAEATRENIINNLGNALLKLTAVERQVDGALAQHVEAIESMFDEDNTVEAGE